MDNLTERDYFAVHAPVPRIEIITMYMKMDQAANPHNDSYKPKLRTESEIIAYLAYKYADAMMEARKA